jgi:deoxyhypusine synthase
MSPRRKKPRALQTPIKPASVSPDINIQSLIDGCFTSFNARSFRKACQVYTKQIMKRNVRIGLSLAGALVPAGLGKSCIIPMIQNGLVDWIVSTGANLYHDLHGVLGYSMYEGCPNTDDDMLHQQGVVRIHDLYFEDNALYDTDAFVREVLGECAQMDPGGRYTTAEINRLLGAALIERNAKAAESSVLATAYQYDVPIYVPSPGDSNIGMNVAALNLQETVLSIDPSRDVNETASIVYDAKKRGGSSAVIILGGGSPKNFLLQTEPHIQEVLGLDEAGHDFFIQFTDARIDTGGLSGATPNEAVTWGKIDPTQLQKSVVCYGDATVYLPLFLAYILASGKHRKPARLFDKLPAMFKQLQKDVTP